MRHFLLALALLLFGATWVEAYSTSQIAEAVPFHVLANPTGVYASMHKNGVITAQLDAGTKISVLEHKQNGWQLVSFEHPQLGQTDGYILSNPYLTNTGLKFGDVYFTLTIAKAPEAETIEYGYGGTVTLTAATNAGDILASHTQKVLGYVDYPVFQAKPRPDLANVDLLLSVSFKPEFHGPIHEYAWTWLYEQYGFAPLPPVMSQTEPRSDWYVETLSFPNQGAIYDIIVKTVMHATRFDEEYLPLDARYDTQVYVWNGARALPQTKSALIRNREGQ